MAQHARGARTLTAMITAGLVVALCPAAQRVELTAAVGPGSTERVSVTISGEQANHWYTTFDGGPAVSGTGRHVVFATRAVLDPIDYVNDHYGDVDIYVRDRELPGRTILISRGAGEPANSDSHAPAISATGRFVAFDTYATNIPGVLTRSGESVIAVCDRDPDSDGIFDEQLPGGEMDHRFVTVGRVSEPGEITYSNAWPSISADGRTIAWTHSGWAGSGSLPYTQLVTRFGVDDAGRLLPPLESDYQELRPPDGYVYEGTSHPLRVSADGGHVAFTARICDVECLPDRDAVFVTDLTSSRTERIDVDPAGRPLADSAYAASISGDGRMVAFTVDEDIGSEQRLHNVMVIDRDPDGDRTLWPVADEPVVQSVVSRTNAGGQGEGESPALSADGRYVAFITAAAGMHNGIDSSAPESQVVVRNVFVDNHRESTNQPRLPGELASPSIRSDCVPNETCSASGPGSTPALSADGGVIAFESVAGDLVPNDTNKASDVFARAFRPTLRAGPPAFGAVVTGTAMTSTVVLRHEGFGPVTVNAFTVTGPDAGDFTIGTVDSCRGAVLHETGQCLVAISFTPSATGTRQATLVIDTGSEQVTIPLTGEGVAPQPGRPTPPGGLRISPTELVFPGERLALSSSRPAVITMSNLDTKPITVTSVTLAAGPRLMPQDFRITGTTCATLQPGASCQVSIVHSPRGGGERLGAVVVNAEGPRLIGLRARGTVASTQATPGVVTTGRVTEVAGTGFPARHEVTITLAGAPVVTASTTPAGGFRAPLLVLGNGTIGTVTVRVTAAGTELEATAPLLVVSGTYQPPGFLGRR